MNVIARGGLDAIQGVVVSEVLSHSLPENIKPGTTRSKSIFFPYA